MDFKTFDTYDHIDNCKCTWTSLRTEFILQPHSAAAKPVAQVLLWFLRSL